jgi:Na+-translocating ferredoxin:NAD+ oxidoreductase RnfD subunit
MALLLFYDEAHIVLGQLGDEFWLAIILLSMSVFILVRVNRWLISLSFSIFYLLFQYWFIVSTDPVLLMEIYHRFYSVSFILFILFMLTDPRTTPSSNVWQLFFAFLIALFSTVLDYFYGFRVQHLFLSLFLFSLFTPLLELWHTAEKKSLVSMTFSLFILATVAIIFIENQTPYYFTMEN